MKNSQEKGEWISIPILEPPCNIKNFKCSDEPAWSDIEELVMKTYFVLKDSHNNYWFKTQEHEYRVSSSACDSEKMIKCTTFEEAELEAIKIIKQDVCWYGITNKVFIQIMIIDEEKEAEIIEEANKTALFLLKHGIDEEKETVEKEKLAQKEKDACTKNTNWLRRLFKRKD